MSWQYITHAAGAAAAATPKPDKACIISLNVMPCLNQGPKRLRRQKNLEKIAKATGEAKAALMEDLLSDKARAKLTRKQLRHERSKAKLEKRRRRKAAKVSSCLSDTCLSTSTLH